jgi:hypothetical protein
MAPFPVYQSFNGVLSDNTTYTLMENITRTTEFTLALDSTGIGIVWNGNGFTITANNPGWIGLFPCPVTVSRLGILSNNTTAEGAGWFFQPGISGYATNCYSTGATGNEGGGIFGYQSSGTATTCYSTGTIGDYGGGIFGATSSGTVSNCYTTGAIGANGGGIFGPLSGGSVINSYTTGTIGSNAGAIYGYSSSGSIADSGNTTGWFDVSATVYLTGTPATSPGYGLTWDSAGLNTPFTLATGVRVNNTFDGILVDNTTYTLMENITRTTEFTLAADNSGNGILWDGNGFTITANKAGWLGLFPCAVTVSRLGILSSNTTATDAGWLFQSGLGGTATNCYSTGTIGNYGGGIFGRNTTGTATNCYSTGTGGVGGGGILGLSSTGTVTNCYSVGSIALRGGGMVGAESGGTATNCYSTGTIGQDGGGIFGSDSLVAATATNCYTTGTLGTGAGGIFGAFSGGSTVNSANTTGWDDTAARTYLTGTPATSPGYGLTWHSAGLNTPFTLATGVRVNNTFDGILVDNTTYIMLENISRVAEFTLAPDNIGTGILWDGNGFRITANKAGWLGLFPCSVDVWNTGLSSSSATADNAGWFFQNNKTGSATNCYSTGDIGPAGGGIFGASSEGGTATNCYSRGDIGAGGGGIFGFGTKGIATNCYSTGFIGNSGGGIFGLDTIGTVINCYATGALGTDSGKLFGPDNPGTNIQSGYTSGWIDVSAATFLTGTPDPATGVGAVWNSAFTNNPFTLNPTTACFFGDAPVLTPSGYRRIDSLTIGDTVTTPTGEDVVTQIYKRSTVAGPNDNPYRIPVGTFNAIEPLLISPRHCIAVNGEMVEARNSDLEQVAMEGILTYYNLGLEAHSHMIVAGVEVESYVSR